MRKIKSIFMLFVMIFCSSSQFVISASELHSYTKNDVVKSSNEEISMPNIEQLTNEETSGSSETEEAEVINSIASEENNIISEEVEEVEEVLSAESTVEEESSDLVNEESLTDEQAKPQTQVLQDISPYSV